jgi:hypothetical protein
MILDALVAVQRAIPRQRVADRVARPRDRRRRPLHQRARGCEVLVVLSPELKDMPPALALHKIGMKLLGTIGGASGPLISSFFMAMGKELEGEKSPTGASSPRRSRAASSDQAARQGRRRREDDARRADPGLAPAAQLVDEDTSLPACAPS